MMAGKKIPPKAASFQVDTRLAVLLGESYVSTERALKELVDNAWDADAENIWITFPEPMTSDPVIIRDDGTGMTEQELRSEYLFIANDRQSRKGDLTTSKKRKVKGRKGIGKFAGLCAAQTMSVSTRARSAQTGIVIDRKLLEEAGGDIERVLLPVTAEPCGTDEHGTTITLTNLDQTLHFPSVEKMRTLLIRDYGREDGVSIFVNDKRLDIDDLGGLVCEQASNLDSAGPATIRVTVADEKARIKGAGIVIRVKGKVIGRPTFLGLDEAEDFPKSLLGKIYGEIEVDGLEPFVTADFGAIIENSKAFEEVKSWALPLIREQVAAAYGREMQLAQARLKQEIKRRLSELPEHRRAFAEEALNKLLKKFYGEREERLEPIVNVVFDAMENDDYRFILEEIDRAKTSEVVLFAEALNQFGLVDLAVMARQARQRLRFLDYLDDLISAASTDESVMHKAIEMNLWVLGNEYTLLASNRRLQKIVEDVLGSIYTGNRSTERPDLLLSANVLQQHVVIEFKRPSLKLTFDNYQQATRYRQELSKHISTAIEVVIVGGLRDGNVLPLTPEPGVKASTYGEVISNARTQLTWLLEQLSQE